MMLSNAYVVNMALYWFLAKQTNTMLPQYSHGFEVLKKTLPTLARLMFISAGLYRLQTTVLKDSNISTLVVALPTARILLGLAQDSLERGLQSVSGLEAQLKLDSKNRKRFIERGSLELVINTALNRVFPDHGAKNMLFCTKAAVRSFAAESGASFLYGLYDGKHLDLKTTIKMVIGWAGNATVNYLFADLVKSWAHDLRHPLINNDFLAFAAPLTLRIAGRELAEYAWDNGSAILKDKTRQQSTGFSTAQKVSVAVDAFLIANRYVYTLTPSLAEQKNFHKAILIGKIISSFMLSPYDTFSHKHIAYPCLEYFATLLSNKVSKIAPEGMGSILLQYGVSVYSTHIIKTHYDQVYKQLSEHFGERS
jgi:hypothetical protein